MTLTREEIINQRPGRILNEWVAVEIMRFDPGVVQYGGWYPSEDIFAALEVEERIAVLEKEGHYVKALCDVVGTPRDGTRVLAMDDWRMIHAKPEQRCKAALLAVLNL